jgi:hypothetical protein
VHLLLSFDLTFLFAPSDVYFWNTHPSPILHMPLSPIIRPPQVLHTIRGRRPRRMDRRKRYRRLTRRRNVGGDTLMFVSEGSAASGWRRVSRFTVRSLSKSARSGVLRVEDVWVFSMRQNDCKQVYFDRGRAGFELLFRVNAA